MIALRATSRYISQSSSIPARSWSTSKSVGSSSDSLPVSLKACIYIISVQVITPRVPARSQSTLISAVGKSTCTTATPTKIFTIVAIYNLTADPQIDDFFLSMKAKTGISSPALLATSVRFNFLFKAVTTADDPLVCRIPLYSL